MIVSVSGREVGHGLPCFVIAEIGINHNGDMDIAKKLIDVAVKAGCDAVKFQKRTIELCYTAEELAKHRTVPVAVLQNAVKRGALPKESVSRLMSSNYEDSTNSDLKYALEFNREEYDEIDRYCREKGIVWFASPWDEEAVDFLESYDPACYKIASARARDEDLLRYMRSKDRPVILSTGACNEEQIRRAVEILGEDNLIVLHCILTYPAPEGTLNLRMIQTLQKWFPDVPIGYSGHEVGLPHSVMAAVLGATVIERHITLDRAMFGSDQAASLEPAGIKTLVRDIRIWEKEEGDGIRTVSEAELQNFEKLRRKNVIA